MPKDEFDPDDPMELSGMAFLTHEDTTEAMTECFCEEFMRLGYQPRQLLALFRNPNYVGPNLALQKRGEPFVREVIARVFAQWGRPFTWASQEASPLPAAAPPAPATVELDARVSDPMGAGIPNLEP
ncbi:MAG TPA: hypothetical protein VN673_04150 [Clostridia bacterium]|nr:hypothetical protein [Clostridia bacterium]